MKKQVAYANDKVVCIDYNDLIDGNDISDSIEEAFGYNGIGLLTVKNVPNFVEARAKLLPLSGQYAALPDEIKEKCVDVASSYSFGWSFGKELLSPGNFEQWKGSFYNNPQRNEVTGDPELIKKYPEACSNNIWPTEDFPQLEPAFLELGNLMVSVGCLVAKHCDNFIKQKNPAYKASIENFIKHSMVNKGRLLHYFSIKEDDSVRSRDSWCGWHNDHDCLTGLCPAMFVDETDLNKEIISPDPKSGLYARTRKNEEIKVVIPKDCIAFQIGESSQILSGGILRATPHAVQAVSYPESKTVARNTFAVFMQPNFDDQLIIPEGQKVEDCSCERFKEGMTFADFHKVTIENYYTE